MVIADVGSGNHPFPLANLLVERYWDDNTHRAHGEAAVRGQARWLVVADVQHLPFRDKSIDYAWCAHCLEHTDNPGQACRELMRVAKAGHVATPAPIYEYGASARDEKVWAVHKWVCFKAWDVESKADGLVFWQKPLVKDWGYHAVSPCETALDWVDGFWAAQTNQETLLQADGAGLTGEVAQE